MALALVAFSQSSTDTMVALQKKQSLLFIRCWLMQALPQGKGGKRPLCPCCFFVPSPCTTTKHVRRSAYLQDLWPQGWNTAEMG